jgi:hypothetical protein
MKYIPKGGGGEENPVAVLVSLTPGAKSSLAPPCLPKVFTPNFHLMNKCSLKMKNVGFACIYC